MWRRDKESETYLYSEKDLEKEADWANFFYHKT